MTNTLLQKVLKDPRSIPMSKGLAKKLDSLTDEQWAELADWFSKGIQRELDKRRLELVQR